MRTGASISLMITGKYNGPWIHRFIVEIYNHQREPLLAQLREARFMSLMIDGATDTGNLENEIVYVKFLSSDHDLGPVQCFLGLQDVKHANADGVIEAVDAGLQYTVYIENTDVVQMVWCFVFHFNVI